MLKVTKIIALLVIIIAMSSCSNDKVQEDVLETGEVEVNTEIETSVDEDKLKVKQEEITIAIRPIKSFNPLLNEDIHNKQILKLVYENLFFLDENMQYKSNIVDKIAFSEDGMYANISIKEDAKWHDGTKIIADDIIYSFEQLKENGNKLYYTSTNTVDSIKKNSPSSITVTFVKSYNESTFNLAFPIVQKKFYDVDDEMLKATNYKTNGSGKYKLSKIIDSRNYELELIEDKIKNANIKKIKLIVLENFDIEVDAFNAEIVDIVFMNSDDLKKIKNTETTNIIDISTNQYEFIALNFKNPIINDLNVRRALAYAMPSDETIKSMYLNASDRTHSNINPNSYLYNENLIKYTEDFEKGRHFLSVSGFNKTNNYANGSNSTDNNIVGIELNILVNQENVYRTNLAKKYAENLKAVGVKSTLVNVPYEEYIERINEGRYDIAFVGYLTDKNQNNISLFSEGNVMNYQNKKIADIKQKIISAVSDDDYEEAIYELQTVVNSDLPVISICYKSILMLSGNEIGNVSIMLDNYFYNVENWLIFK